MNPNKDLNFNFTFEQLLARASRLTLPRKRQVALLLQTCVVIVLTITIFSIAIGGGNNPQPTPSSINQPIAKETVIVLPPKDKFTKTILLWNENPDRVEIASLGSGREAFSSCNLPREEQCELVTDRSLRPIESYDAIVVNAPVIPYLSEVSSDPLYELFSKRKSYQRLVFFSIESPVHTWGDFNDPSFYTGHFNWTMTYKLDSNILLHYGRLGPRLSPRKAIKIEPKPRLIAYVASHCHTNSRREEYINELNRYVAVDTYGDCGFLKCPRSWDFTSSNCYDMLEQNYKFYLSFENAICTDYITEKFFQILQKDVVPVVYGGGQYSRIAPPNSYIDASQFRGPKQLAKFLKMVAANDTLYGEYLAWKKDYVVTDAGLPQMGRHGFCDLCRKLHHDKRENSQPNLVSFWGVRDSCFKPVKKWWIQNDYIQQSAYQKDHQSSYYHQANVVPIEKKKASAKKIKIKY